MGSLKYYRSKIDNIDKKISKLLLLRFNLAKKISKYKKSNKIKIIDRKRELQVIKNIKKHSKRHEKFMKNIFKSIISYSRRLQK